MNTKKITDDKIHIYVINLDRRPDRMMNMEKWLNQISFPWTRVVGVDGIFLSDQKINQINKHAARRLGKGEIGCLLSHVAAWNLAISDAVNYIWIMEDDVYPKVSISKLNEEVNKIINTSGWDIMYLTGKSNTDRFFKICSPEHLQPYLRNDQTCESNLETSLKTSLIPFFPVGPQIGAYSYILSISGIQKVSSFFEKPINPVDVQLGQMNTWLYTSMWRLPLIEHLYDGTSDSQRN